jgi:hypothetical protein
VPFLVNAMATHKVKIGETVFVADQNAGGPFVVIKVMPERHGQFEYRARSSYEPYERVVRERQLRAERAATLAAPSGLRRTRATGEPEKAHDTIRPGRRERWV